MTGCEVDAYLVRAAKNVYNIDIVSSVEAEKLLRLIDEKYVLEFKIWYQHTWPGRNSHMDDHLRSILTALAGPHGRTLLKVLEINKAEA